jgi:hypothetical protein
MAATAYDEPQWVFNVGEPVEKIFIVIPDSTLRLGSVPVYHKAIPVHQKGISAMIEG